MRVTLYLVGALALGAVTMAPSAAHARMSAPAASTKAALDDPTIVAIFDAANAWDVEASEIGEKKATASVSHPAANAAASQRHQQRPGEACCPRALSPAA